ncbi:lipoprotein [Luminiphilus sp. nBUS_16]
MKMLILATLLLSLLVGCGQIGPLRPAEPNPPAAESAK